MATTKSIADDKSIWITTFFGGPDAGRSQTITMVKDGRKAVRTFTQKEFEEIIFCQEAQFVGRDDGVRPDFDG